MNALQFLLICLAGRLNRNQQLVIEYLPEEAKVLREQSDKKPRFTDDQRRQTGRQSAEARAGSTGALCLDCQAQRRSWGGIVMVQPTINLDMFICNSKVYL